MHPVTSTKASTKRRNKKPGAGYAIVTDDKIMMKSYSTAVGVHFMEFLALLTAIKLAKPGDVIYTDQKTLIECIETYGDPTVSQRTRPCNYIIKSQILRALKQKGGITLAYLSSKEAKKKPCGSAERLADQFAGFASGAKTKHVLTYKGDREVFLL